MIGVLIFVAIIVVIVIVMPYLFDLVWFNWLLPKVIELNERTRWSRALSLPKRMSHSKWVAVHEHMEDGNEDA